MACGGLRRIGIILGMGSECERLDFWRVRQPRMPSYSATAGASETATGWRLPERQIQVEKWIPRLFLNRKRSQWRWACGVVLLLLAARR